MITIGSLAFARGHKRRFDAVITVEDPGIRVMKRLRFHKKPHPDHLVLRFEDLDFHEENLAGPDVHHVKASIAFGRLHVKSSLLVHCHAGVSRSTALALAILADRMGDGEEDAAVASLLDIKPDAAPNLDMLSMADRILQRNGNLERAWLNAAEGLPRIVSYRKEKADLLASDRHLFSRRPYCGHYPATRFLETSLSPAPTSWIAETSPDMADVNEPWQTPDDRRIRTP